MTTINRLESMDVTINFELPISCLDRDDIKAMSKADRQKLRSYFFGKYDLTDNEDRVYWLLHEIEDEEYREENMDEFKKYEARMNEPDFDWDHYSDWHKDMFGYRPHFRAIPANESERQRMYETWHQARGL